MRMQRQKVKGTGHKQPADAQTEPNFYAMPPSQAQLLEPPTNTQKQQQKQLPQKSCTPPLALPGLTSVQSDTLAYEEMSPGIRSVHGAAHLLKRIAAGLPANSPNAGPTSFMFSGASATSSSSTAPRVGAHQHPTAQAPSLLPPAPHLAAVTPTKTTEGTKTATVSPAPQATLSLLGRVTAAPSSSALPQPMFVWPPVRRSATSPNTKSLSHSPTTSPPKDKQKRQATTSPHQSEKKRTTANTTEGSQGKEDNEVTEQKELSPSVNGGEGVAKGGTTILEQNSPPITNILLSTKREEEPETPEDKNYSKGDKIKNESSLRQARDRNTAFTDSSSAPQHQKIIANASMGIKVTKGIETEES